MSVAEQLAFHPSVTGGRLIVVGLFVAFVATVVAANWALGEFGTVPVAPGLEAPAGVYFAGLAFGLRDALHERAVHGADGRGGRWVVLAAIAVGAVVSYAIEGSTAISGGYTSIAAASAAAFALSELADLYVYEPLRRRSWAGAAAASNAVGAAVDSALFLWLAFGSFDHFAGQYVGKVAMIAFALPLVWLARRRRAER